MHCAQELNHLARFLPELHAQIAFANHQSTHLCLDYMLATDARREQRRIEVAHDRAPATPPIRLMWRIVSMY